MSRRREPIAVRTSTQFRIGKGFVTGCSGAYLCWLEGRARDIVSIGHGCNPRSSAGPSNGKRVRLPSCRS
jgi:hypothetical protein